MTTIIMALLAAGTIILLIRTVLGPTVADRIVGIDTLLILVMGLVIANAVRNGNDLFADVALVIALLAFVGTSIAARFIEQRGT